jgi:hypothetical protein
MSGLPRRFHDRAAHINVRSTANKGRRRAGIFWREHFTPGGNRREELANQNERRSRDSGWLSDDVAMGGVNVIGKTRTPKRVVNLSK